MKLVLKLTPLNAVESTMRLTHVLVAGCIVTGPGPLHAQDAALQATLDSARRALGAPGASAAIVFPDGRLWRGVSGMAGPDRLVQPETVFDLGSVAKTYTAALVLRTVADGRLRLDDTLARWYPELPGAGGITLRQLLNHTSGLHDPLQEESYVPLMLGNPGKRWSVEEILEHVREPYHAPGAGWHYTNTGFQLAGRILEHVSDTTLTHLYRSVLFEPLGLDRTHHGAAEAVPPPRSEAFIDINDDGTPEPVSLFMPMTAFLTSGGAAGGIVASAADAARWLHALATGEVLSAAAWSAMTSWVERPDGARYGLGLLGLVEDGEVSLIGHKGNAAGFSAAVFHVPAAGMTVAVLTSAHATDVTPAARALLSAASGASSSR